MIAVGGANVAFGSRTSPGLYGQQYTGGPKKNSNLPKGRRKAIPSDDETRHSAAHSVLGSEPGEVENVR
jgi:hypothetical protein